jgi:hypothetical protein
MTDARGLVLAGGPGADPGPPRWFPAARRSPWTALGRAPGAWRPRSTITMHPAWPTRRRPSTARRSRRCSRATRVSCDGAQLAAACAGWWCRVPWAPPGAPGGWAAAAACKRAHQLSARPWACPLATPTAPAQRRIASQAPSPATCAAGLPRLTSPHLTSPHLTSPHLTSPHLTRLPQSRRATSSLPRAWASSATTWAWTQQTS